MQISKKIPFDDPNVLNGVRALYIVSNIIIAAIYFYVQMQINKKNGASTAYRSRDIAGLYALSRSHADISQT